MADRVQMSTQRSELDSHKDVMGMQVRESVHGRSGARQAERAARDAREEEEEAQAQDGVIPPDRQKLLGSRLRSMRMVDPASASPQDPADGVARGQEGPPGEEGSKELRKEHSTLGAVHHKRKHAHQVRAGQVALHESDPPAHGACALPRPAP